MTLYWVIEYKDGKHITEKEVIFNQVNKLNIRSMYFYDGIKPIGFYADNGLFFIGNAKYDFKVGNGPFLPIQFKTASVVVNDDIQNSEVVAWNIGYLKEEKHFNFKYLLTINKNREIILTATKEDSNGNVLDLKKMQLQ